MTKAHIFIDPLHLKEKENTLFGFERGAGTYSYKKALWMPATAHKDATIRLFDPNRLRYLDRFKTSEVDK